MHKIHHVLALVILIAAQGCGTDLEPGSFNAATAGAAAAPLGRWTGIQSCKGTIGKKDIVSSDDATIDHYTPSKTRVQVEGVIVGPSADYSCGPLDFEGVVTMASGGGTFFESPTEVSCSSPGGRTLVVSEFDGYDLDQRSAAAAGGKWNLKFDLHVTDEAADGGVVEQTRADITCHFEFTLQ